jgi:hypothetical protein
MPYVYTGSVVVIDNAKTHNMELLRCRVESVGGRLLALP